MKPRYHPDRRRGIVLLVVLVFIFLLGVIVSLFLSDIDRRIQYRLQTGGDRNLRKIAYQHLEHSLAILREFKELDGGLIAPAQGWGSPLAYEPYPIEYPGVEATVQVFDLSGSIPLSQLSEDDFVIYLESLGMNSYDGAKLRDAYFDWTDADDEARIQGAEKSDYERDSSFTLEPRNAAIESLDEFELMIGFNDWVNPQSRSFDPDFMNRFVSHLTLLHNKPVNINSANASVLEFFRLKSGLNPRTILDYKFGRDRFPDSEDDRIIDLSDSSDLPPFVRSAFGSEEDALLGSNAHTLHIVIDLNRYDLAGFHLEAVVTTRGGATSNQDAGKNDPATDQNSRSSMSAGQEIGQDSPTNNDSKNAKDFEILVINEKFVESLS